ncbi:class I poly(R)-hydroxyalkanoic acid synthase [Sinirhodobacter sp. WL0062]|uniref:Class I poly(R)-hydroxyalkanoic acid synthase n=1 Tax=Rhodobacter flavimaris TaxID=2907145 RepID=A0ABS8YZ98_9RHOB|nr:class I poly(R)-hydroxyalkanoic acid synthase [Sinirhodobacter sp. WL0062]MCE5973819.1 class I poly(R)-hydroxyalkanoic acid synthase [Sinirhodobacter sp. WL0062]
MSEQQDTVPPSSSVSTETIARQGAEFLDLMTRLQAVTKRSQEAASAKISGQDFSIVDYRSVVEAYMRALPTFFERPLESVELAQRFWLDWAKAWQDAWTGEGGKVSDKRFRDRRWNADPVTRGLRDSHLALERATEEFLSVLPQGTKDSLRVRFYTRQLLSALSPSNFLMLNPAARERLLETEGRSLLDGFRNLVEDLERGEGRLDINTNDASAFVVGKDLAVTPGKVVYENDLMQLIHYEPLTKTQHKRPLLFVPPWINKYYIFDMRPDNSMVRYMLEQGHSVFLISWVNPTEKHAELSFEDYMKLGPLAALDAMEKATGEERFDILGFCIGGILVTATLALLAARGDKRIVTATTLATMVDFTNVGEVGVFIDRDRLAALRTHMAEHGYLENYHLQDMFSMIRENDLVWSFHVMNYLMGQKPPAFDLLYWNADSTRLPAAMLLWYLEKVYIENGLRQPGYLTLDGTPIDLGKIEVPFFVLATKEDHIAPWTSIYPTTQLLGGDVTFVLGGSGHIAGVINPPADRPKYGYWTRDDYPEKPEDWLAGATQHSGSWWPAWAKWIDAHDEDERVPARRPGKGGLKVIEDAPGRYVLAK